MPELPSLTVAGNVRAEIAGPNVDVHVARKALRETLGISVGQFNDRYTGRMPWSINQLFAIAEWLKIDVMWLIKRK